jgi:hypothetical protein
MLTLSFFESFAVQIVISLLTLLESKLTNTTEIAALQAAIKFLQTLLTGGVSVTSDVANIKVSK